MTKLFRKIFERPCSVNHEADRGRAQILSVLSVSYMLLLAFVMALQAANPGLLRLQPFVMGSIAVGICACATVYGLSRTRHFAKGCTLFVASNAGTIMACIYAAPENLIVLGALTVLAVGPVVSSVVVSARQTAILATLTFVLFLGESFFLPGEFSRAFALGLIVFSILSILAFIGALMRGRLDSQIRNQQAGLFSMAKFSSLGEMAGGVAHEINTPLAVIIASSGQMVELLADERLDRAALSSMASMIAKTGGRIARIVQGLRSISRDGSRDAFQPIGISALIEDTVQLCRERFTHHQVRLSISDRSGGAEIYGRETEISQVLLNLLNNAFDAIGNLPEKWVRIDAAQEGAWVTLCVTDCGKGISEKLREKIFQPFFTTKEIGKGTGLGLSISRGIIQNHGGELSVDIADFQTSFVLRLPRHGAGMQALNSGAA